MITNKIRSRTGTNDYFIIILFMIPERIISLINLISKMSENPEKCTPQLPFNTQLYKTENQQTLTFDVQHFF